MDIQSLDDLFLHTLQDIYYAEKRIIKALPKMIKKADSKDLAAGLEAHLEETREQLDRLQQIFDTLGERAKGTDCPAIDGILEEAEDLIKEIKDPDTRDAAMIAAAQAVEHYEITRYGTLASWAKLLGHKQVAKLLQETLAEEYAADKLLTKVAESHLNAEAIETGRQSAAQMREKDSARGRKPKAA